MLKPSAKRIGGEDSNYGTRRGERTGTWRMLEIRERHRSKHYRAIGDLGVKAPTGLPPCRDALNPPIRVYASYGSPRLGQ